MEIKKIANHDMNLDVEGQNPCLGCKEPAKTRLGTSTPGACTETVMTGWVWGDNF